MADGAWPVLELTGYQKEWGITKNSKFLSRKSGKIYSAKDIMHADVDTPGAQFLGFITKESYEKTHCIDDWDKVDML